MTVMYEKVVEMGTQERMQEINIAWLPKVAQKIYNLLISYGKMTSGQIAAELGVTDRTIRTGLQILYQHQLIMQIANMEDMRSHYHQIVAA